MEKKRVRLSKEQVTEMTKAYADGAETSELAAKYNVSVSTLYNWLRRRGIPVQERSKLQRIPEEKIRDAMERYDNGNGGVSVRSLARECGVSQTALASAFHARGVRIPPRNRVMPEELKEKAVELARSGETYDSVAGALNISASSVSRYCRMAGLSRRRGPWEGHPRLTDMQVEEMAARYRAGETQSELASSYGVTVATVGRRLRGAGVQTRGRRTSDIKGKGKDTKR